MTRVIANNADDIIYARSNPWDEPAVTNDPYINVTDEPYGATGDGVTDDTEAVQAALDDVKSTTDGLYFPAGDYLVTGLTLDDISDGIHIRGAGSKVTRILTTGSDPIFSLGTYDATPSTPWIGTVDNFKLEGVTLANVGDTTIAHVTAADQTSIGIQDNGCGDVTLTDVRFEGLAYGVYAPYGHDYCRYYDVDFKCCTTGIYLGPGSQQIYIFGGSSTLHDRAIVIDGAPQGAVYGFVFNEPQTRDIDILSPTTLESGVSGLTIKDELAWSFDDCWFETGAGWDTSWGPTEHVRVGDATDSNTVRGIVFRNVNLISGTTGMAEKDGGTIYAFLNADAAGDVTIDKIQVAGDYVDALVTHPAGEYPKLVVHDANTVDGYTEIPVFDPWTESQQHITSLEGYQQTILSAQSAGAPTVADDGGRAIRMYTDSAGSFYWASYLSGAWRTRLKFDPGSSRLSMGSTVGTNDHSISWGSAAPASGDYLQGDIVYNTGAAAEGYVGWVCTVAGTPGTWKGFGLIEA